MYHHSKSIRRLLYRLLNMPQTMDEYLIYFSKQVQILSPPRVPPSCKYSYIFRVGSSRVCLYKLGSYTNSLDCTPTADPSNSSCHTVKYDVNPSLTPIDPAVHCSLGQPEFPYMILYHWTPAPPRLAVLLHFMAPLTQSFFPALFGVDTYLFGLNDMIPPRNVLHYYSYELTPCMRPARLLFSLDTCCNTPPPADKCDALPTIRNGCAVNSVGLASIQQPPPATLGVVTRNPSLLPGQLRGKTRRLTRQVYVKRQQCSESSRASAPPPHDS